MTASRSSTRPLDHGRAWNERSRRLSTFDRYAGEMVFAAGDVFASQRPEAARQKLDDARRRFLKAIQFEQGRRDGLSKPEHSKWLADYLLTVREMVEKRGRWHSASSSCMSAAIGKGRVRRLRC